MITLVVNKNKLLLLPEPRATTFRIFSREFLKVKDKSEEEKHV